MNNGLAADTFSAERLIDEIIFAASYLLFFVALVLQQHVHVSTNWTEIYFHGFAPNVHKLTLFVTVRQHGSMSRCVGESYKTFNTVSYTVAM